MCVLDSGHVNERIKNRPQFSAGCPEQAGRFTVPFTDRKQKAGSLFGTGFVTW
jgi:hypothetical protein